MALATPPEPPRAASAAKHRPGVVAVVPPRADAALLHHALRVPASGGRPYGYGSQTAPGALIAAQRLSSVVGARDEFTFGELLPHSHQFLVQVRDIGSSNLTSARNPSFYPHGAASPNLPNFPHPGGGESSSAAPNELDLTTPVGIFSHSASFPDWQMPPPAPELSTPSFRADYRLLPSAPVQVVS
ncbi:hypothetical protein T492DRAFT_214982 [Pavlovales sp. CCMP2436]|nr:hypothetical protein T492DRAFT_214982 [Pavlovales sp. CCMP2436]